MWWLVIGMAQAGMDADTARAWELDWRGDREGAAPLFAAACQAGSARACAWMSRCGKVPREERPRLRETACRESEGFGPECEAGDVRAGTWVGRIYADGLGADRTAALAAYDRACGLNEALGCQRRDELAAH